jgi:hypothetical protein
MKYQQLENNISMYQSNIRAEDRVQQNDRWKTLYEEVLVPIGFIFALLLVVLLIMLIRY